MEDKNTTFLELAPIKPTFKAPELNTITDAIYTAIREYSVAKARAQHATCVALATCAKGELYKKDGYDSLEAWAAVLNIDKSKLHKLEQAGRLMISDNATIRDFAANSDYSKLAMLYNQPPEKLEAAIKDKKLSPESTASEVRAWKDTQSTKTSDKAKVLPRFHIVGMAVSVTGKVTPIKVDVAIDTPAKWAREYDSTATVAKVKVGEGEHEHDVYVAATSDGGMFRYTAGRILEAKKSGKTANRKVERVVDVSGMTDDELLAELQRRKAASK